MENDAADWEQGNNRQSRQGKPFYWLPLPVSDE